ncbi:MAG TPA: hypothetical protein VEH07_07075 [Alphaproteobacteria bacterium]|nr:hypothetical protein [Alphaproteobacteria bacterium]
MSSADEASEETTEPVNPRRTPDVVRALARTARRDPHRDVLKPIGRVCFLISLVVFVGLARPLIEPPSASLHLRGNQPLIVLSRAAALFQHVTESILSIDLRRLINLDIEPREASMLMLGGLFGFGFYYFAVYLVAMNAVRFSYGVGTVADATIRRAQKIAMRLRKPKAEDIDADDGELERRPVPQIDEAKS